MPSIIKQGTVYGVPAKLGGLTDVTLSTPTSGQSLVYSNGAWVNQEAGGVFYGVCNTEPTVSNPQRIWTVTLNNGDGFALTEGATVYIKFTHEETGDVYPTFPCLNVNDTGAKPIYMNYTSGNTGYVPRWREGQVCVFTYDGNHKWFQINSVQSALLTPYSNSSSGLTATNVQSAINEVNTKTVPTTVSFSTSNFSSKVTVADSEIRIERCGKIISMYCVFKLNSALSANEGIISNGGIPKLYNYNEYQFQVACVAGTNAGKVGRVRITKDGGLTDWYSQSGFFASGCVYLVDATYFEA